MLSLFVQHIWSAIGLYLGNSKLCRMSMKLAGNLYSQTNICLQASNDTVLYSWKSDLNTSLAALELLSGLARIPIPEQGKQLLCHKNITVKVKVI